jgi:hypothetical protein
MPANDLVKNFLGRPQAVDGFVAWMNQEFEKLPSEAKSPGHQPEELSRFYGSLLNRTDTAARHFLQGVNHVRIVENVYADRRV